MKNLFLLVFCFSHFSCALAPKKEPLLVDVSTLSKNMVFDLRYATENNRTGVKLLSSPECRLRPETARKLVLVQKELEKQNLRLKIWDAYRPPKAQEILWKNTPDDRYVTPPSKGSDHSRGVAVDVTLTDWEGRELEMGTPFDYLSRAARYDFQNLSPVEKENRKKLRELMLNNGFLAVPTEWWHFYDSEWERYEIIDRPICSPINHAPKSNGRSSCSGKRR